jgi:ankyrin repeat protein
LGAAADNSTPEAITVLLGFGADPKAKDTSGKMALDYARENEKLKDTDVFRELEKVSR